MEAQNTSQMQVDPQVDHDAVLDSLRAFHAEYLRREQGLVLLAVQWARLNPGLKRTMPDGTPNTSPDGVDPEDLLWEELAEKWCPHMDPLPQSLTRDIMALWMKNASGNPEKYPDLSLRIACL